MKINIKIIIFIVLVLVSYQYNYSIDGTDDVGLNHFLLLHHLLALYISIGWILLPKRYLYIYLYITLATFFHWILNNNQCVLTEAYYHLIGKSNYFNKSGRIYLRDIYWLMGARHPVARDLVYRILVISGCIYCLYNKIY